MKTKRNLIQTCLLGAVLLPALTSQAQPIITSQPVNPTVVWGGNATFSVMATGVGPLTYQWQLNGTNLPNNIITTVAGNGGGGFSGDGGAATNTTIGPNSALMDVFGNLFIADRGSFRIRKVGTNGIITTVAGNGAPIYSGDGGAATNAGFNGPVGLAMDVVGNIFVADANEYRVRKVSTNGIATTIAGGGAFYSGDGGAATNASLGSSLDVAVDSYGNIFVASGNRIRKVDTNGIITTMAGNGSSGFFGDGGAATNANLKGANAITLDASGNLFIADTANNRVRKVDTHGIITTVAGNASYGYSGDGGVATNASLFSPMGVAVDVFGNLLISDNGNNRIRVVDTNGIITTVAGNGPTYPATGSYSGDGSAATNASLNSPQRISVDASGSLFIADANNHRIRKVALAGSPVLTVLNLSSNNAGNYSVIITSASGSVTSSVVTVNLQLPPITPAFTASNSVCTFTWSAVSNQTYQLQAATNLVAPNWIDLGAPITATNNSVSATDAAGTDGQRFYRVRLWP